MSKTAKELLGLDSDIVIGYLSEDSRDIKPNTLFFCLKGATFDAHKVVADVIAKGATVIVHTDELDSKQEGIIYYKSKDIKADMALVATRYYNEPSHKMNLIGITGTNGKTTIAWLLYYLLNKLSKAGYIGTNGIIYNNQEYHNLFTTPKAIELNYHLAQMVEQDVKYCALEVSSHALAQERTAQLLFKYAIMTNLTFEHVNFHGSMANYQEAKRLLFEQIDNNAYAILNSDDSTCADYQRHTKAKVISYGIMNDADVKASNIQLSKDKTSFDLKFFDQEYSITTNLIAQFNVYNLIAALIVLKLEGYELETIIPYLSAIEYPQGRMEHIDYGQDFDVIVDFAHTPDGLEKVFEYAKAIAKGDIIAVFGSAGGNRDHEKRPVFGKIAARYAKKVILTQDDNREEDVMKINKEIAAGISGVEVIFDEDRLTSVENVIRNAKKDDMIVILGKGNDTYNVGARDILIPYEGDVNIVKRILEERGYQNEEK